MSVVVGYDGRDGGRDALALGCSLARETDTDVIAVNVRNHVEHGPARPPVVDVMLALEVAEQAGDSAAPKGLAARIVESPDPAEALGEAAARLSADLLVIGACRRRAGRPVPTGAVNGHIADGAPCRVAIAPLGYAASHKREALEVTYLGPGSAPRDEWSLPEVPQGIAPLPELATFPC